MPRRLRLVPLLLLALASCAPAPPAVPPATPASLSLSPPRSPWPGRTEQQALCLGELAASGAAFEPIGQAEPGKDGCTLENGVRLISTTVQLVRPVELTCPMAVQLVRFEREVLMPEALRIFGTPLGQINHAGGFTCKRMTGNGSRISEHGHGRAIDLWGFRLRDNTRISVADDYRARSRSGEYLRGIQREACRYFGVVLGPSSDAAHARSLHWDISQWSRCGV